MPEVQSELKPILVSEEERSDLLTAKTNTPEHATYTLQSAVPKFIEVLKGNVLVEYGIMDGLLNYHVYRSDRKKVYDKALKDMEGANNARCLKIAEDANTQIAGLPWWSNAEDVLQRVFSEHFRNASLKVTFFPEVDSWSVVMPEPDLPGARSRAFLEAVVAKLALQLGS